LGSNPDSVMHIVYSPQINILASHYMGLKVKIKMIILFLDIHIQNKETEERRKKRMMEQSR
jgi:hypothetical protein